MELELRATGLNLALSILEYAKRRMRFALDRVALNLDRVILRLTDANGPRGGVSMTCRIAVGLKSGRSIFVGATDESPRVAVDRAADRAARAIGRKLERIRNLQVKGGKVGRPAARPGDDQELLLQQGILGGNGSNPARSQKLSDGGQQVPKQDEQVFHGREA